MVHLKSVIHSASLHNKIPSEVPLEHAYTSASALERETSFCVLEQEYKRHPPRKMVAQETESRLVLGPVTVREDLHDAFSRASSAVTMEKTISSALPFQ